MIPFGVQWGTKILTHFFSEYVIMQFRSTIRKLRCLSTFARATTNVCHLIRALYHWVRQLGRVVVWELISYSAEFFVQFVNCARVLRLNSWTSFQNPVHVFIGFKSSIFIRNSIDTAYFTASNNTIHSMPGHSVMSGSSTLLKSTLVYWYDSAFPLWWHRFFWTTSVTNVHLEFDVYWTFGQILIT